MLFSLFLWEREGAKVTFYTPVRKHMRIDKMRQEEGGNFKITVRTLKHF